MRAMQCTRCGAQSPPGPSTTCPQCGAPLGIGGDAGMRMLLPVGRTPLAIAAGYLGLFSVFCFVAPLALVVGILAVLDLKKKPGMHGMGRAVFGIVMGALGTIGLLLFIVAKVLDKH
jgi:hypothetical protein